MKYLGIIILLGCYSFTTVCSQRQTWIPTSTWGWTEGPTTERPTWPWTMSTSRPEPTSQGTTASWTWGTSTLEPTTQRPTWPWTMTTSRPEPTSQGTTWPWTWGTSTSEPTTQRPTWPWTMTTSRPEPTSQGTTWPWTWGTSTSEPSTQTPPWTTPETNSTTETPTQTCSQRGYFPNNVDCRTFSFCDLSGDGRLYRNILHCPNNYGFDPSKNICIKHYNCRQGDELIVVLAVGNRTAALHGYLEN